MSDTRIVTNYLKGFAIISVVVNHFVNEYVTDSLRGYANGFISLFFLLSGYGIYLSLSSQPVQDYKTLVLDFFKKRFLRVYPLLWIWCLLYGFPGILGLFALDFIAPDVPWFVPAIVQCYIVTPIIFLLSRKMPVWQWVSLVMVFFCWET